MGNRLSHAIRGPSSTRPPGLARDRRVSGGPRGPGSATRGTFFWAIALATGLLCPAAYAQDAGDRGLDERRVAWGGVVGGALSPSDARALEAALIDALGRDERILLVDAGGRPLGPVAREKEVARVKRMLRDGIDQVLRGRHEEGRNRIDQAVALFENALGTHPDHDVLHDALLAQSESLFERGQTEAARTTLERLHALSPRLAPEEPRGLVAIWRSVIKGRPRTGRLEIDAAEGATIFLDGRPMGSPPVVVPAAALGHHLIGVAWPDISLSQTVQVTAGRPARVRIERPELADRARQELADAVTTRLGPATVTGAIPRVVTMSGAAEVVVAVVRPERAVFLARHGADGMLRRVVGGTLPELEAPAVLAQRLAAVVLLEVPLGGFRLGPDGAATSWIAASSEAYGGAAPVPPVELAGLGDAPREDWVDRPGVVEEEASIVERPWFWVLVGGVVAGLVVGGVVLAQPAAESTVFRVVLPSGSGLRAEDR